MDRTDYKGWAKGLKKAGYATSPTYATALIDLIERWELHQYDLEGLGDEVLPEERIIAMANGAKYVKLEVGVSLEDIAQLYKRSLDKILEYTFQYGNVLYCMNNETSSPVQWGNYWIKYMISKENFPH